MNWLRWFRRTQRDAESAREMQFYLDTETEDNIARGMPPEQARRAARRKLGNTTLIREEIWRMNGLGFLETVWQDLRYALRTMRRSPAFTVTAVLTLAVGIGGNTAMFTVIDGVLLKPLDYRDPGRLVYFSVDDPQLHWRDRSFSLDQFREMRADAKSFMAMSAYGRPENVTLSGTGEPEMLKGARVSANFLETLGIKPLLGRSFLPEEDVHGGRAVAMISAGLWKRRFGGDPEIVGKAATLQATPYTIIGVLPRGFEFPFAGVDVWVTKPSEWSIFPPRYWDLPLLNGFGRLKPHVSLEQARAEMNVLLHQYGAAHPGVMNSDRDARMVVVPLKEQLVSDIRPMLCMLFGAVGFVLLIACANVAGLLLARASTRSRELAVRAAVGASRGRLIRQLAAESAVLAAAGGALGALLAKLVLSAIPHIGALNLPRAEDIKLNGAVLGFTVALSLISSVLFGLLPSLEASRLDLVNALRASGVAARPVSVSTRGLLVVGQVALSIVLLIGAALLLQSLFRLHNISPGFQPVNLLTAKIALPPGRYDTDRKKAAFFRELLPRLQEIPGVRSATMSMSLPGTTWIRTNILGAEGGKPGGDQGVEVSPNPVLQSIMPGYFRTLQVPLKRGREFTARDNAAGTRPVMMVNESLARQLWPGYPAGVNPIGRQVREGYDKAVGWMQVVGIAADIHEGGLAYNAVPEFYVPCSVHPPQTAYLVVRTTGDPMSYANAVRKQVLAVDKSQPVSEVRTMNQVLNATLGQRRLTMWLLGTFAGVALLLAVIGIYGVIAYSVAQRTQEVGIRMALGAERSDILRLVVGQGLVLTTAGVGLGLLGAFVLTRVMKGLLFGVSATDPLTFVGVALLFVAVALIASYLPARRAARIDPMMALRME